MADAAVSFLLDNVSQLLLREVGLVRGVRSEIKSLKRNLALIRIFLRASEGKRDLVKEVVADIQSMAEEAEDAIDTFVVEMAMHKRRNLFQRFIHKFGHTRILRGVASKVKMIKNEISTIYGSIDQYGIVIDTSYENSAIARRKNLNARRMQVEEDEVVSFLKDAEIVMDMLKAYGSDLDIISIIGMGGLGKTTLAKKIYNDITVKKRFGCRAWVNVSEEFRHREVFLQILQSVGVSILDGIHEMDEEKLAKKLRSLLQDKKYLIVLDDVWKPKVWTTIKGAFPDTKNGSRILITSRNKKVASHASKTPPYLLPFLNEDESWELLSKKAFRGGACPPLLETIGRQISKKCKGLPLALVVVGGMLATREQTTLVWSQMFNNMSWHLDRESESCKDVLALSYRELPEYLKPCFLYLGVYPEDYEMSARQLIRLWVAEGLVEQDTGLSTPEDIADEYLQELASRCLIMVKKRRSDGGIKSCNIHDLLRDLCITEAAQDNFFVVHDGTRFIKSFNDRPRRISLLCKISKYSSSSIHSDSSLARSLLCFGDNGKKYPPFFFEDFRLARVMDFSQHTFKEYEFSPKFEKLVLLRYLRLGRTIDVQLPRFICNLPNLQTLDLRGSKYFELSRHFWKMQQLRHLLVDDIRLDYDSQLHIKTMPNLQTLAYGDSNILYAGGCDTVFPNLRKLKVKAFNSGMYTACSRPSFGNIQNLKIIYRSNLFSHGAILSRLRKLTLYVTRLSDAEFSSLLLPNLEILKLKEDSLSHESKGQLTNKSFCKLQVLHMNTLRVDRWWVDQECLTNLKFLKIVMCYHLPMAPESLKDKTTSRHVEVTSCSKTLENSFRALGLGENTRIEFNDNDDELEVIA